MAAGDPIKGTLTQVMTGPALSEVEATKIEKYTLKTERSSEDVGPFFNDDNVIEIPGAKKGSMELEGMIPEDGDAGQDDMIAAYEADTAIRIAATTTRGKVITFAAARIKSYEITTDAKGFHRIKFSLAGAYTVAQHVPA